MTDYAALEPHISEQRLHRYRCSTSTKKAALDLYEWNAALSAAFLLPIGHCEVAVRNAVHSRLADHYQDQFWFLNQSDIHFRARKTAQKVNTRLLRRHGRNGPKAGHVVAELTFGFWTKMLSNRYEKTVWVPILHKAFPEGTDRKETQKTLTELNNFRNRIAHHEPIYDLDLESLYTKIIGLAEALNPKFRAWIEKQSTLDQMLNQDPRN